ncbi:MAG: TSUP family transporter [Chromatiales bacterium]|jgi:hypothetical protein
MELITPETIAVLAVLAALAGLVDAIAGGGGLLTIPALLWAGLTPVQALGTNKLQAVFGSFAATVNFAHKGEIRLRIMAPVVVLTFAGASVGALAVQHLGSEILDDLIPLLLIGFALYFLFSPRVGDLDVQQRITPLAFGAGAGAGIGFYDGFFGPGTGSFFALAFVSLLGYNLRRATAHAKLLNFTSNLAALLLFTAGGHLVWAVGLPMALGQVLGGYLGSHMVLRHGARLVRPLLVVVSLAMSLRLLLGE